MYLKNLKDDKPVNFVYTLGYSHENGLIFKINPCAAALLEKLPVDNLIIRYCKEKLHVTNFEPSIEKSFGFDGCSKQSFVDDLIQLSFPPVVEFELSKKKCEFCHGKKKNFLGHKCYYCRETGMEINRNSNINTICVSLHVLTRYLNWTVMMDKDNPVPENKFGLQDFSIELDASAGAGGQCSETLFKTIKDHADEIEKKSQENMKLLYYKIEGREYFPKFDFHVSPYDFRCDIKESGGFYFEVPGQNGCSIHMDHHTNAKGFTCHNVDSNQQHLSLISGFATMIDIFNHHKTPAT